jgi:hypothetical protein
MDVAQFVRKWRRAELTERSAAQQHFLDLCELVDHPKPAEVDATGASFTFEKGVAKHGGGDGWAEVWKRGFFGWEYKGRHKDLGAAYEQLLKYREALENPPLLVVCDLDRIVVHTNFTNTPATVHEIALDRLAEPRSLEILRAVFGAPERLKPGATSESITAQAAEGLAEVAAALRSRGLEPRDVAHYLDRIVFCLFAEDIGLLPEGLFSKIVGKSQDDPARFSKLVGQLFAAMADGGDFGMETIRHFDGNLFTPGPVLELTAGEIERIVAVGKLDWSAVDPSVFGTLFERAMDQGLEGYLPMVSPEGQLYGIEVSPYAHDLAQMTVWIGYLQWTRTNGFGWRSDPVLRPMDTFKRTDAILDLSDPEHPREPEWPAVDFIVGNPTTCFETFPFPEPSEAQKAAIGAAAKELDALRTNWLNPPEWTREEVLEFPGSSDGPWARYVVPSTLTSPSGRGPGEGAAIGLVRYPRLVAKDPQAAAELKKRTLTAPLQRPSGVAQERPPQPRRGGLRRLQLAGDALRRGGPGQAP